MRRAKGYGQKKPGGTEEELQLFEQLKEALNRLGIEVRLEKGDFRGGLCTLEGERKILFVNKKHTIEKRIDVLINELMQLNHEQIFLPPGVREKLYARELTE